MRKRKLCFIVLFLCFHDSGENGLYTYECGGFESKAEANIGNLLLCYTIKDTYILCNILQRIVSSL
jgi:hypothetical protein